MNTEINYKSNPLNGVGLKTLLSEIVDHYGFQILFAYLNINCFKNNPSIESSVKFLKKTDWARNKVEAFYLYKFKNLPQTSSEQPSLPPRDLIFPNDQMPGTPAELSLEDAEQLSEERVEKAAMWDLDAGRRAGKKLSGSYQDTHPKLSEQAIRTHNWHTIGTHTLATPSMPGGCINKMTDIAKSEARSQITWQYPVIWI